MDRSLRLALAAVGFTSIVGQLLLMRELVAVFYGNELVFGLILAAWMLWVAVGSWGLGRFADRYGLGRRTFAASLVLASLLLLAQIALVRASRILMGVTPGALAPFASMVGAIFLTLAPLCLLLGFQFAVGARLLVAHEGSVGGAYAWESAGAVVGGLLFSFVLVRLLNPFQTALSLGAINLALAAAATGKLRAGRWIQSLNWPRRALLVGTVGCFLAVVLPLGAKLHQATLKWQWQDLAFAGDSIYGRLTVVARDGQRVFFESGLMMFETQGTFPEEVAHFPLLAHPAPERVLLIGGGVAGDLREILKHPVRGVTYVDLDPLVIEAARRYLPEDEVVVLDDPRVEVVLMDGRLFVRQTEQTFDVVILDLPEPSTGQLNRFYTAEFFREVGRVLAAGGVFSLGLPSAENYWSPELARRNASVYHTLNDVFAHALALPGEHNFFLASDTPLPNEPGVLIRRYQQREVKTRWVTPDYVEYVFATDRFRQVREGLAAARQVKRNTDLVPVCYYYDLVLWLSRLSAGLSRAFYAASLVNLGWLPVPLLLAVLWLRWRRDWAVPAVIGATGLSMMALEVVVLFGFQALHGYVYHEVSLVITAFMAGLTLGAAVTDRLVDRRLLPGGPRRVFLAAQVGLVVYAVILPALLRMGLPAPELAFPVLALVAGALGGAEFPLAVALTRGTPGRVAGRLYGADLVGGCLGAVVTSTLLIPVLGLPVTCYAVAALCLAGAVVL